MMNRRHFGRACADTLVVKSHEYRPQTCQFWNKPAARVARRQLWGGFKVFMTFKDRFYPDLLMEGARWDALPDSWSMKNLL